MERITTKVTEAGGLGTPLARWVFIFVWFCGVWLGFNSDGLDPREPLNASLYLLGLVGSIILTTPGAHPLPIKRSMWLPLISTYIVVIVLAQTPEITNIETINFAIYLVAFAIPRGNPLSGGIGCALVIGYALLWALSQETPLTHIVELLSVPIGCLVAGIVWAVVLRRIVLQERQHRSAANLAAEQTAASLAAIQESREERIRIRNEIEPLLTSIINGSPIDNTMKTSLRKTEAAIRDRIIAPHLQHPNFVSTIAQLRDQDVTVVVLGEPTANMLIPNDMLINELVDILSRIDSQSGATRVTIRTLPPGRQAALSIVVQHQHHSEQTLLSTTGAVTARS